MYPGGGVYLKQNLKTTLLLGWVSLSRLHHASTFSPAKAGCDLYLVRVRVRLILRFGLPVGVGVGVRVQVRVQVRVGVGVGVRVTIQ
eukprot:scaffold82802_cov46-Phaeocystis_antarctica.AAC.1